MEQNYPSNTGRPVNVSGAARPVAVSPSGHPVPSGKQQGPKLNRSLKLAVGAFVAVALVVGAWLLFTNMFGSRIDGGKYQALFLTNGQVYFGKLHNSGGEYMRLTDIYYMQAKTAATAENPQATSAGTTNVELIKLGNEVHGPVDEMMVRKDQILFFENLKTDGQVAKTIATDKNKK